MYALIFDTTAAACSIVLSQNGKIISSYSQTFDFGQSEILLPEIQKILASQKITFGDIDAVFVCVGPGSFTGVRASISAAKVFAIAKKDLIVSGFSAFDAYKACLNPEDVAKVNAVIIETRRDDFYVRFYDDKLEPLRDGEALSYDEIIDFLRHAGGAVTLIGDGVERFLNQPSGLALHSIKMCDSIPLEGLNAVVLYQQKNKKYNFPKPLYIRAADVTLPKN